MAIALEHSFLYKLNMPVVYSPCCATTIHASSGLPPCSPEIRHLFNILAESLLSIPCCRDATFFREHDASDLGALEESIYEEFSAESQHLVHEAWLLYSRHESSAEQFLDALLQNKPSEGSVQSANGSGDSTLRQAPPKFMELLSPSRLPSLIGDAERRVSLQLAYLRRFPSTRSPCCGSEVCFACKSKGWHGHATCQQLLQRRVGCWTQFCPHCGVPTEKNGGCNHTACACGADWTWQDPWDTLRYGSTSKIAKFLEEKDLHAEIDDGRTLLQAAIEEVMQRETLYIRNCTDAP